MLKKERMRPFLTSLFSKKIIKALLDLLKGAAPLNGVKGYNIESISLQDSGYSDHPLTLK